MLHFYKYLVLIFLLISGPLAQAALSPDNQQRSEQNAIRNSDVLKGKDIRTLTMFEENGTRYYRVEADCVYKFSVKYHINLLAVSGWVGPQQFTIKSVGEPNCIQASCSRLSLWITQPVGLDPGEKCALSALNDKTDRLSENSPMLRERDVSSWNASNGHWALNRDDFPTSKINLMLEDHCFVLALGGKLISSGIVLSSHSARLTRFPTLLIYSNDDTVELQLISANGGEKNPIHLQALDGVLGSRLKPRSPVRD